MNQVPVNKRHDIHYKLETIKEIDTPDNMPAGNWCRYVIGEGTATIICIRSGTLEEVTRHAEDYANDLNSRASNGSSPYSPRSQKK